MNGRIVLVAANRRDRAAADFVAASGSDARLMTPGDLSERGWRFRLGDAAGSVAVVGGERIRAGAIAGVLTRAACVTIQDLPHIVASDRPYVAAEMTAFLLAWLSALECPVINRPTPQCLCGPAWGREKWANLAMSLGIPTAPALRRVRREGEDGSAGDGDPAQGAVISVVGRDTSGQGDIALGQRALALAEAASVDLLAVQFDGHERDAKLVIATPHLDLADSRIAEAVAALMRQKTLQHPPRRRRHDPIVGTAAG